MKKTTFAAAAAMGVVLAASQVSAEELWSPHLPGIDIGLAAGALPPQGVYFVENAYYTPGLTVRPKNSGSGLSDYKLTALVDVPILLWNPGFKILGADYAVAIAQPFDNTQVSSPGTSGSSAHLGTFNTVVVPAILSWSLPYDFHVKPSFAVFLDDASSSENFTNQPPRSLAQGAGTNVGAGMANYTFEGGLGISWLHDGWNASAQFQYDSSTQDNHSALATTTNGSYQSGDQFSADYTLTKAIGKWTVGIGGYQLNQVGRDKIQGDKTNGTGTMSMREAIGPVVGYQFGGIGVQAQFTHEFVEHNDVGGDVMNVRFVVPIY